MASQIATGRCFFSANSRKATLSGLRIFSGARSNGCPGRISIGPASPIFASGCIMISSQPREMMAAPLMASRGTYATVRIFFASRSAIAFARVMLATRSPPGESISNTIA